MSTAALVGGQFGSEGKGLIAGHIAKDFKHHVRVGAANAGHTVYTFAGNRQDAFGPEDPLWDKHVLQQIPCAAYANPEARLYIGPGALISTDILNLELLDWSTWRAERGLPHMVVDIDPRAHVIRAHHIAREAESGLAERIGSTSTIAREGIGAAQAARIEREEECVLAAEVYSLEHEFVRLRDVPFVLDGADGGILLEGTQGAGLSLTTGKFPYVTSRNTTAAGLCADAGLPPTLQRVIMVCRTYPIRVAGPSGPFWPDSKEILWGDIGVDADTERTTVTKKIRRVATFSIQQVTEAAILNGATEIALTFADYIEPGIAGREGPVDLAIYPKLEAMVQDIEEATSVAVTMIGTGPHSVATPTTAADRSGRLPAIEAASS